MKLVTRGKKIATDISTVISMSYSEAKLSYIEKASFMLQNAFHKSSFIV